MSTIIHRHAFVRATCLHGETDTHDSECQNSRLPGSVFCAAHQPPHVDQCACGERESIKRYLIISRFGRPNEEGWVCPACLINDAPGFEFYEDAGGDE